MGNVGTTGATPALEGSFVGRDIELGLLVDAMDRAVLDREPRCVVVEGSPGIGKSRLTRELVAATRNALPGTTILYGRCPPPGSGGSNWAPAEMLRHAFGIGAELTPYEVDARLMSGVAGALEPLGLSQREIVRTAQALAASAGMLIPGNPYDRAEPRDVQAAIVRAWSRMFNGFARAGSVLVVLEDIHWASASGCYLIDGVTRSLEGPLLHLFTTRPGLRELRPGFLVESSIDWISLPPLSGDACVALVEGLLGGGEAAPDLVSPIIARSEGNPFYVEETVRHMVQVGALRKDGGRWHAEVQPGARAMPDTLASVMAARIAALPVSDRRVLQEAAVIGRDFWEGALRSVLGDAGLDRTLGNLSERGLIQPRTQTSIPGHAEWTFKHVLVQGAAYDTLTDAARARSHAAVGAWLADLPPETVDEVTELIAMHFLRATELGGSDAWDPVHTEVVRSTAFRRLIHAGDRARQRSALDRAGELHRAALALATSAPEQARAQAALARDLEYGLAGQLGLDQYRLARETATRAGLPEGDRARICLGMGRLLGLRWGGFPSRQDPAELDEVIDEGLRLASDPETRYWLLGVRAAAGLRWSGWAPPDPRPIDERLQAAAAALEGARRLDLANLEGIAMNVQGYLQHAAGRPAEALATLRDLGLTLQQLESPYLHGLLSMWVSFGLADLGGDYRGALVHAQRSLEIGRARTPHELMHGTMAVMWCQYHLGDWAGVRALLDEHLAALQVVGASCCPYLRAGPVIGALALAHGGDIDRAREVAGLIEPDESTPGMPEALLARVAVATGQPAEGARRAREMVDGGRRPSLEENDHETHALIEALQALEDWEGLRGLLPRTRARAATFAILEPVCDRAEALVQRAAGDTGDAIRLLQRACDWFERAAVPFELARTKTLMAPLTSDGDRLLAEAIEVAQPLFGAPVPVGTLPGPAPAGDLSPRERQILALIADGKDNSEIAAELVLSLRTVERHVSNIYLKLGLEGRTARAAAVSWAHRRGGGARPT
jgi:DNA-binding CsgD family transcriptional regulator